MNTFEQLKEGASSINLLKTNLVKEMDNLADNIFSSIHHANFSIKLISDTRQFLTRYLNDETSFKDRLKTSLTEIALEEITLDIYNNMAFNSLFISAFSHFEDFFRMLGEAFSFYLASSDSYAWIKTVYGEFCNYKFIRNDWDARKKVFDNLYNTYHDLFEITVVAEGNRTPSQETLFNQYSEYKRLFDNLKLIFNNPLTSYSYQQVVDLIIPAMHSIVYFKTSPIYTEHIFKLEYAIEEMRQVFDRILNYTYKLSKNLRQNSDENIYLNTIIKTSLTANDFISALVLKYPNQNTYQELITDGDFNYLINIINTLYKREIESLTQLIDSISTDYKLYRSLETFVADNKSQQQKSQFNKTLHTIMSDFDKEILETEYFRTSEKLSLSLTQFFNKNNPTESFTNKLHKLSILTEPLYDILNYYRLFAFYFLKESTIGASLIFDFLFTLYIHSESITNQQFNTTMKDLFEIKLNNIDYININTSKINETITSKYQQLTKLDYFNIQPYIDILKQTNTTSYTNITDLTTLFQSLPQYNLILFTIIENILYSNANLSLIMQKLSITTNIRTIITKLFFYIAINKLITTISTYYSNNIPDSLQIYTILQNNSPQNSSQWLIDLNYLKTLITVGDFYKVTSTIFNISKITNWYSNNPTDYIWDPNKLTDIIKLFSVYKEV